MDPDETKQGVKRKQPDSEEDLTSARLEEVQLESEYDLIDDEAVDEEELAEEVTNLQIALNAQEQPTLNNYDGIKLTPFNMRDELEEGEFDSKGNYVFSQPDPEDNWVNSIDWDNIDKCQKRIKPTQSSTSTETTNDTQERQPLTKLDCYKQILRIMKHDETIQKCIRRLGNAVPKRGPDKNRNRSTNQFTHADRDEDVMEAKRKLNLMIDLAHQRLEDGDVDIYQRTYEELEDSINL